MTVKYVLKKGGYFDSVKLMQVARQLREMPKVLDAAAVMATPTNKNILKSSGLWTSEMAKAAAENDALIVVKAKDATSANQALAQAEALLAASEAFAPSQGESAHPQTLEAALKVMPQANLAVISVAGRYAGLLALQCLQRGLHVMLFSDNVPLDQEISLKQLARKRGLLVMGPDCGTAIINGAPLGFANAVRRGRIGVIASSGTGLQEVTCLISNAGSGISQAIGTGSRDVKKEVGGITFIEAIKALAADDQTAVLLLISKPPDPEVVRLIQRELRTVNKPVVSCYLGQAEPGEPRTLEEAALLAVELERGGNPENVWHRLAERDRDIRARARALALRCTRKQRFVRGLFTGGTFCAEAQLILAEMLPGPICSNTPVPPVKKLKNSLQSVGHSFVDFGDDEFTVGRPHPMIDYSLRNDRIVKEAADPEVAVILLDVVLGYGANPRPAEELAPVVAKASRVTNVVCSITGTERDPQVRSTVEKALIEAGAVVMPSNAAACRLAGEVVRLLEKRG